MSFGYEQLEQLTVREPFHKHKLIIYIEPHEEFPVSLLIEDLENGNRAEIVNEESVDTALIKLFEKYAS